LIGGEARAIGSFLPQNDAHSIPAVRLDDLAERNGGRWVLAALAITLATGLGLRVGYAADGRDYQPPDSRAYARIAESLYRDGSFDASPPGSRGEAQPSSSYSPGLPFLVAGVYWLSGGVHLKLARIVLAVFGAAAVLLAYLLGRRLSGPLAGLLAAVALAIYPALIEYQGLLLTEPLASFLLPAGLLLSLRARDSGEFWALAGAGALLGALALVRPEYLVVALMLPVLALLAPGRHATLRRRLLAAAVMLLATGVVLAPWTVRNLIELDRLVPVSTGGGKALYIGTYLDADGDGAKLRGLLLERRPALRRRLAAGGRLDDPNRYVLERVLTRVAAEEYPDLDTDQALGRLARDNLPDDITDHPAEFASMLASKAYDTWTEPARGIMNEQPWRTLQLGLLIAALLGLGVLAFRRRFEALLLGTILLYVTTVGAVLVASPRRELVVLPLLAALAGAGLVWLAERLRALA
jgi:Dolichyl-phosphate-mannose-protein mannosyltransferase